MADRRRVRREISVEKYSAFRDAICGEFARDNTRAFGAQITATNARAFRHGHRGVSNPPGRPRDRAGRRNRGVAHAPAPSVTPPKWVSCAAQNAALGLPLLSSQVVGVERLARGALADTGSSTIGID